MPPPQPNSSDMEKLMQMVSGLCSKVDSMDKRITSCESGEPPKMPHSTSYAAAATAAKSIPPPINKKPPAHIQMPKTKGKTPGKAMFSFAQGQEEPFPGVNFFGVKVVSYHSLLCDVKGVDVSEPGF